MKTMNNMRKAAVIFILAAFCCLSCNKKVDLGTFFVKGRVLTTAGVPVVNKEIYIQILRNNRNLGGSYIRERVATGATDSLGNFHIEATLYGDFEYSLEPYHIYLTPGVGVTLDMGILNN
jgi:hypothetical protein